MTVNIVHLFPSELGASGDSGNALTLEFRLRERGVATALTEVARIDDMPGAADLVVIGTGPWSAAERILPQLEVMGSRLRSWFDEGVPFVAVGTGAEVLGESIRLVSGRNVPGLGLFPLTARRDAKRVVGYVESNGPLGRLVGFGDLSSVWERSGDAPALGSAIVGPRRLEMEDGVIVGNSLATQIGGPVLPLNPDVADWIIRVVLARRGQDVELGPLAVDDVAEHARGVILDNFDQVFTTIAL